MAVNTPQAVVSTQESDEAEFEAGLARLKEIHIQLRNLRTTILRMIQPFVANHSSPEGLYDDFSKAAVTAATEIKDFRDYFQDRRSRLAFRNSAISRRNNPEGISTWRVTEHPDWLERDGEGQPTEEDGVEEVEDGSEDGQGEQDVSSVVEEFTNSHPGLKVQYNKELMFIELYLPPAKIHFRVQPSNNPEGKKSFRVTCLERRYLHAAILECVATRPKPDDLNYLLNMLASYADVTRRPCDRCGKLLNSKPQLATGRRRIKKAANEGQSGYSWEAYH